MFGAALLVAPVLTNGSARDVYLPRGCGQWRSFHDGRLFEAGWASQVAAPLEVGIPLFGRAGSVLLLGPELQWSAEKPADPIEVRQPQAQSYPSPTLSP